MSNATRDEQSAAQRLAVERVLAERERQDVLWGEQNHDPITWTAILTEEVGEATHGALGVRFGLGEADRQDGLNEFECELVHVAAVALAALECCARQKVTP